MYKIYKCTECGNHITTNRDDGLICQKCNATAGFIESDDQSTIDPSFCNDNDQITLCPCGVFSSHLINTKCNLIETATAKEPEGPDCHCKSGVSPCGHSVSHRVVDPCIGQA